MPTKSSTCTNGIRQTSALLCAKVNYPPAVHDGECGSAKQQGDWLPCIWAASQNAPVGQQGQVYHELTDLQHF